MEGTKRKTFENVAVRLDFRGGGSEDDEGDDERDEDEVQQEEEEGYDEQDME